MAKQRNTKEVKALDKKGNYRVDSNLYILAQASTKAGSGTFYKSWRMRRQIDGKRKWITLGTFPEMSLQEARSKVRELSDAVEKTQRTPTEIMIEQRAERKAKIEASNVRVESTFKHVANVFLDKVKRPSWKKTTKTEKEWVSRFERLIFPVIGHKIISQITTDDILEIIEPLWMTSHETADRCRSQISNVIDFAIAKKISDKANPAGTKILKYVLPEWTGKVEHLAALPFDRLPNFWADLCEAQKKAEKMGQATTSHDALKLVVLTGCRSLDVRAAEWDHMDLDGSLWNATINKATTNLSIGKHKVPLPDQAKDILTRRIQEAPVNEYVFPSGNGSKIRHVSEAAIRKQLGALGYTDEIGRPITIHGFRSCFMDWVRVHNVETTETADQQLAHVQTNEVLAAYARSDLVSRRAKLMQKYADYAEGKFTPAAVAA